MNYLNPQPLPVESRTNLHNHQFNYSISIDNATGRDVTIIGRDGFPVLLNATTNIRRTGKLYIHVTVNKNSNVSFNQIAQRFAETTKDRIRLEEELERSFDGANGRNAEIRYCVDLEDLEKHTNVFFDLLDIVISIADHNNLPLHPRTSSSVLNELNNRVPDNMFNFNMYIVDHSRTLSNKYIRIGKAVFKIPIVHQHSCPDGIYIVGKTHGKRNEVNHFLLDDPDCPIQLYDSESEAKNLGGLDLESERAYQLKIAKYKTEQAKLNNELHAAKAAAEKIRIEISEQQARDKLERDKIEAELQKERADHDDKLKAAREKQKHVHEDKTNSKKAMIEMLKIFPPVLTVLTLIITVWTRK